MSIGRPAAEGTATQSRHFQVIGTKRQDNTCDKFGNRSIIRTTDTARDLQIVPSCPRSEHGAGPWTLDLERASQEAAPLHLRTVSEAQISKGIGVVVVARRGAAPSGAPPGRVGARPVEDRHATIAHLEHARSANVGLRRRVQVRGARVLSKSEGETQWESRPSTV